MPSNFEFLQDKFPVLADYGQKAEKYLYSDSNSCLMKLGMIGETIVNLIFKFDRVALPYDNTPVVRIDTLSREGLIDSEIQDILHSLRKVRNRAVHENYASVDDGKTLLGMAYSLCVWFYQVYGDYNYQPTSFVMPSREAVPAPVASAPQKKQEEDAEQKLMKLAEEAASASPVVDRKERKKKAAYASNQRPKSEAETRYLIDEQLRKVGWEADTNALRYSKGTRPKKGHNMAIAEWPTDSTVGNNGRCDYMLFIGEKMVATVEAKAMDKDVSSVLDYQCKDYSRLVRGEDDQYRIGQWGDYKVPFTFATNGRPYLEQYKTMSGIWFYDLRDPSNAPMALRGWMSPIGMAELLEKDIKSGNRKLGDMSFDLLQDKNGLNLREYQVEAIKAAENAIMDGAKTVLLAMATGTGKTRILTGKGPPVQPIQPDPKFSVKVLNAEKLQILQFVEETLFEDPDGVLNGTFVAGTSDFCGHDYSTIVFSPFSVILIEFRLDPVLIRCDSLFAVVADYQRGYSAEELQHVVVDTDPVGFLRGQHSLGIDVLRVWKD